MLTGARAFAGDEVADTLAAVIRSEPDWRALPADTPSPVRRLLRRCLAKDPRSRIADASTARLDIDDAIARRDDGEPTRRSRSSTAWALLAVGAALAVLIVAIAAARALRPVAMLQQLRLDVATPPTTNPQSVAISPDGTQIAYVATADGVPRLWLRSLSSAATRSFGGTDGATLPFWSAKGESIGFFASGKLRRLDVTTGAIVDVVNSINAFGGAWNSDDVIVFSGRAVGPLLRVSASGSAVEEATRLDPKQLTHRAPVFLPDGQHFLYYATGPIDVRGVYVARLGSREGRRLFDSESAAVYAAGHLLFERQGTLIAQPFDPVRLVLMGRPQTVADDVGATSTLPPCSVSASGTIAYRPGARNARRQLAWFDRSGRLLGKIGEPATNTSVSLAPDDRWLVVGRSVGGNPDIWTIDTERGRQVRLTSSPVIDFYPIWTRDGRRIVFQSHETEPGAIYDVAAAGGTPQLLLSGPLDMFPTDASPDGKTILFQTFDPATRWDVWSVSLEGERKPVPIAHSGFDERGAVFSPDGKWIAYASDESGRSEVYVQPFPSGLKLPVSSTGGAESQWRPNGEELFYLTLDSRLMSVPVRFGGPAGIDVGTPVSLFRAPIASVGQGLLARQYASTADGQRFVINTAADDGNASAITIILNWRPKGAADE